LQGKVAALIRQGGQ